MTDEQPPREVDEEVLFKGVLPIQYGGNEDVVGIFADQVIVSNLEGMFTLYFYQMQIPPVTGDPSSVEARARVREELKTVYAKCVARVVLTPKLMEEFYRAMGINLERYNRVLQAQTQKSEE